MASKPIHPAEDRLECLICLSEFTDPRMLPCLHTLCKECIEDLASVSGQKFQCPACRHECKVPREGASGFPKNFLLNDVKDLLQELNDLRSSDTRSEQSRQAGERECDNAKNDSRAHGGATAFCEDCKEFYCESCASYHGMLGISSNHQLRPVSEVEASTVPGAKLQRKLLTCDDHPNAKLEFYCNACHIPVCTKCCLLKHKLHQYRELTAVGKEYQKRLEDLIQAAGLYVNKMHEQLKELKASIHNIQKDTWEARQRVQQAANRMRDLVSKREKCLLQQIQDIEQKAIAAVNSAQEDKELKETYTESLLSCMQALHDSGDITDQVVHTPVLEEQLHQQETAPLKPISWTASFREVTNSVDALNAMLGTITAAHHAATSLPVAGGNAAVSAIVGKEMTLGQPLDRLKIRNDVSVSGLVVVDDFICATVWFKPHLYVYNTARKAYKQHTLKGLQAVGMTTTNATNTFVIADSRKKLHFVSFNQSMDITKHKVKHVAFEPRHISIHPVTGQLVIADNTNKAVVICDAQGNAPKVVQVRTDVGDMRCAVVADDGYVVLDCSEQGRVHWVDSQGRVTRTYGHRDGEGLCRPCHMVRTSQGQLVVADSSNDRLHLVDTSGRMSCCPLTRDDRLQHPVCVWLQEATSSLYVAHRPGDYSDPREIRVYGWPYAVAPTAPSSSCTHALHLRVGTYS